MRSPFVVLPAVAVLAAVVALCALAAPAPAAAEISLERLGSYRTGVYAEGASEISAYDPATRRLFITNGSSGDLDVVDIADPTSPTLLFSIDLSPYGAGANSVATHGGRVAAAVENHDKQLPGKVVFFAAGCSQPCIAQEAVTVGALPDMLTFTPDGRKVVVANEGEPNDDYTVDPEGSISIVDVSRGVGSATVVTAGFAAFNGADLEPGIRIFGPGATVAQDLEPEYVAVSHDSRTAWVTLQENNAVAVVDLRAGVVTRLAALGTKQHRRPHDAIDASNRDGAIRIRRWPVHGMYQPDAIAAVRFKHRTFLITANEGDARVYEGSPGFDEEARVGSLTLDPRRFPDAAELQLGENLGRLKVTATAGDRDGDGDYDFLLSFGARSFSVWTDDLRQAYDSGDHLERLTAAVHPDDFNSDDEENDSFDDRSDDKGPEPEGLDVGVIDGRTYLFLGLERVGGIVVYDVSVPYNPHFITYRNDRDFTGAPGSDTAGDMSPEGVLFIPAADSPTGEPLLVVSYEVSGSTTVYRIAR